MKKLILLLTICILTSCFNTQISSPAIVTCIENAQIRYTTDFTYKVTINNKIDIFTNTYYNIGDTLK